MTQKPPPGGHGNGWRKRGLRRRETPLPPSSFKLPKTWLQAVFNQVASDVAEAMFKHAVSCPRSGFVVFVRRERLRRTNLTTSILSSPHKLYIMTARARALYIGCTRESARLHFAQSMVALPRIHPLTRKAPSRSQKTSDCTAILSILHWSGESSAQRRAYALLA